MFTGPDNYHDTVMKWTAKEMQLNRLHEEIVARRESLHNTSENYQRSQAKRGIPNTMNDTVVHSPSDAACRNRQFLEDIHDCQISLNEDINTPASTRFITLQSNYWAMVNGLFPLWERSCIGLSDNESKTHLNENYDTVVGTGVTFATPISSQQHSRKTT